MAQNGGNWGKLNPKKVILAGAAGILSGGLGTITSGLGVTANIAANVAGSAAIGAGQQVGSNLLNNECWSDDVVKSAAQSGFLGGAGAKMGSSYNSWRQAQASNALKRTSNGISGPFYPPANKNWAIGGTATGNLLSNGISNSNQ